MGRIVGLEIKKKPIEETETAPIEETEADPEKEPKND